LVSLSRLFFKQKNLPLPKPRLTKPPLSLIHNHFSRRQSETTNRFTIIIGRRNRRNMLMAL
jgi:hypothetical protein